LETGRLLPTRRRGRHPRAHPSGQDRLLVGDRDPQLPRDPDLEWANRGPEPHCREASKDRARNAQLREL